MCASIERLRREDAVHCGLLMAELNRDVIRGVPPYVVILILFSILTWFVPAIITWLPQKMS